MVHCVSVAPSVLKNALNKACLQVPVLSGADCRVVPSCECVYRRGFGICVGICESFHQPLNYGGANTKNTL